ncbi:hypothetical protein [Haliangium ochraceum]|nr:hypothetical protein [Haliangium ochraceum]
MPDEAIDDFAAVGDELWVVQRACLRRHRLSDAAALGEPQELSPKGSLIPALRGPAASAVWLGEQSQLLMRTDGVLVSEAIGADIDDGFSVAALLGGRRLILANPARGELRVRDVAQRVVSTIAIPQAELHSVEVFLEGRTLAICTQEENHSRLTLCRSTGQVIRHLTLPPLACWGVARERSAAIAYIPSTQQLFVLDLRYGRIQARHPAPFEVDEIFLDPKGERCILAGFRPGQTQGSVLEVPLHAVLRGALADAEQSPESSEMVEEDAAKTFSGLPPSEVVQVDEQTEIPVQPPPDVVFRAPSRPHTPAFADGGAEGQDARRQLLGQALCHAALLVERLLIQHRALGLLPSLTEEPDALDAMVVSETDVAVILRGFRSLSAELNGTWPGPTLPQDPNSEQLAASRARLRDLLDDPGVARMGLACAVRVFELSEIAIDLLVLAAAAEWDLRFGRLFGFLNNDIGQQRLLLGQLVLLAQRTAPGLDETAIDRVRRELLRPGLLVAGDIPQLPVARQMVHLNAHLSELIVTALPDSIVSGKSWDKLRWQPEAKEAIRSALHRELHRVRIARC